MRIIILAATSALALAAPSARAELALADGKPAGIATIKEENGGLRVSFMGQNLPLGPHAVHIHTTGKCEGPTFESAGGHWNPTNKQHGTENPMGPHLGDLPTMNAADNGVGSVLFTIPGATLAELMDADGAAFMVHADADDNKTDPAGNAGGRIACGVIAAG